MKIYGLNLLNNDIYDVKQLTLTQSGTYSSSANGDMIFKDLQYQFYVNGLWKSTDGKVINSSNQYILPSDSLITSLYNKANIIYNEGVSGVYTLDFFNTFPNNFEITVINNTRNRNLTIETQNSDSINGGSSITLNNGTSATIIKGISEFTAILTYSSLDRNIDTFINETIINYNSERGLDNEVHINSATSINLIDYYPTETTFIFGENIDSDSTINLFDIDAFTSSMTLGVINNSEFNIILNTATTSQTILGTSSLTLKKYGRLNIENDTTWNINDAELTKLNRTVNRLELFSETSQYITDWISSGDITLNGMTSSISSTYSSEFRYRYGIDSGKRYIHFNGSCDVTATASNDTLLISGINFDTIKSLDVIYKSNFDPHPIYSDESGNIYTATQLLPGEELIFETIIWQL